MTIVLYVAGVLVVTFALSGVRPRHTEWRDRVRRVQEFERRYRRWVGAVEKLDGEYGHGGPPPEVFEALDEASKIASEVRPWLTARRDEMQRDAAAVGRGVIYVAPPPMIGGSYKPHAYFLDLFDRQTDSIGSRSYRLDDLVTIIHEAEAQRDARRRDLYNPGAWVRRAFERLVGFPAYVLKLVGFSDETAGSSAVKAISALWSLGVGGVTIAGFVLTLAH